MELWDPNANNLALLGKRGGVVGTQKGCFVLKTLNFAVSDCHEKNIGHWCVLCLQWNSIFSSLFGKCLISSQYLTEGLKWWPTSFLPLWNTHCFRCQLWICMCLTSSAMLNVLDSSTPCHCHWAITDYCSLSDSWLLSTKCPVVAPSFYLAQDSLHGLIDYSFIPAARVLLCLAPIRHSRKVEF